MEQEFETYKLKVNRLFEQPRFIILSQEKDIDERKKTEMTLHVFILTFPCVIFLWEIYQVLHVKEETNWCH